jgi:hydrogenase assembly chaperone HypC/HupF
VQYRLNHKGASITCLTFPGKVVSVKGEYATVDYGEDGVRDDVNISLVDAHTGSYVLVQGGFAIKVMSKEEAEEVLYTWKLIRELQEA